MKTKTKVIDLTQHKPDTELKPITFEYMVNFTEPRDNSLIEATDLPSDFDNIELISRDYQDDCDVMFAYDNDKRNDGILFFGKFNDGVVA